jgi:hypothetical protein
MNNSMPPSEYQNEIDIRELFSAIWSSKKLIFGLVFLFSIGSIITAYVLPKVWVSTSLLSAIEPSGKSSQGSSSQASGLGGIVAMAGLNLSEQTGQAPLTIATINSRDFFNHLLTFDGVLSGLMAIKGYDEENQKDIFKESVFDSAKNTWVYGAPSSWDAYKAYRGALFAELQPKTGFVKISVKHRSPKFAKSFLDLVLREINSLSRVKDQKEASAAIDYLNTLLVDTLEKDMRNMLTGMIQSQVKTQMLSEIKDNYVLEPIDTPYLPLERTSPQRTRLVLLGTLLGFIIALLISIFRYYGTKYKFFNS